MFFSGRFMAKIMFFAHDPGGANAIAPLIHEFKEVFVFGKGPALEILPDACRLPETALKNYRPDFLITGTSCNDFTERYLWKESRDLGIKSMAILDLWISYGVRFSRFGTKDLHLFKKNCEYLPDYVCVMDEIAKEDMINDGVPENIILPFGNPHFEYINLKALESNAIAKKEKSKDQVITFASQPFDDIFRRNSEIIALEDLIKIFASCTDVTIKIRKHPKEPADKFKKYLTHNIMIDDSDSLTSSLAQSDIIISVNSMLLIEAMFFHKKILSYQPKAVDMNDFILTRNKTLPFITNTHDFKNYLLKLLKSNDCCYEIKFPISNIIARIKNFVLEEING
jgi:hypothetical protein